MEPIGGAVIVFSINHMRIAQPQSHCWETGTRNNCLSEGILWRTIASSEHVARQAGTYLNVSLSVWGSAQTAGSRVPTGLSQAIGFREELGDGQGCSIQVQGSWADVICTQRFTFVHWIGLWEDRSSLVWLEVLLHPEITRSTTWAHILLSRHLYCFMALEVVNILLSFFAT